MACDVVFAWDVIVDGPKVGVKFQGRFVTQEVGFALCEIDHGVGYIESQTCS